MPWVLSRTKIKVLLICAPTLTILLLAGGGFIQVLSTNQVNCSTGQAGCPVNRVRFEPSSSSGSTWMMSWMEYTQDPNFPLKDVRGYTTTWNGSWAQPPFEHRLGGHPTGDLFLAFDQLHGVHNLAMVDVEPTASCALGISSSNDSPGSTWSSPVVVKPQLADYPSVAVASDRTVLVGTNRGQTCNNANGFEVYRLVDGGQTWDGPYVVTTTANETFGRIVASGSTFHYLYVDTSSVGVNGTAVLKRKQSIDGGLTWPDPPAILDTYTAALNMSPEGKMYCSAAGPCARIYYATNIDAASSSGLGWVVLYPTTRSDDPKINNLKFCAEALSGCTTISYSTDLFQHSVATSSSGDIWMSMHTFANPGSDRPIPLQQIGIYRAPDGTYVNGFVVTAASGQIDPTSWALYYAAPKCSNTDCWIAGDYMRIAMNQFTSGSLPFVRVSAANQTDLMQSFVQEPPTGVRHVPGLQIGPVTPLGRDSRFHGRLSAEELRLRLPDTHTSVYYLRQ